ncbi:MAG: hypothetical protein FP833_00555 [Atribacteria sp.]|nr:hypothetical protein [Candidatus Atribacteria bacterium]
MKLEIKRVASEYKALLGGLKFNYSINLKLTANDDEKNLWDKYKYNSKSILVIRSLDSNSIEPFEKLVQGGRYTSFNDLLKGSTWESKELYLIFTEIPTIIAERLIGMDGELNTRENWNGNDETVDLT